MMVDNRMPLTITVSQILDIKAKQQFVKYN